jgi:hypothetical protein
VAQPAPAEQFGDRYRKAASAALAIWRRERWMGDCFASFAKTLVKQSSGFGITATA